MINKKQTILSLLVFVISASVFGKNIFQNTINEIDAPIACEVDNSDNHDNQDKESNDPTIQTGKVEQLQFESVINGEASTEVCTLSFSTKEENEVQVEVAIVNPGPINPYQFTYAYEMAFLNSGVEVDLAAVLVPSDFFMESDMVSSFEGQQLLYPTDLKVGDQLDKATGVFAFTKDNSDFDLAYQVENSNRKVIAQQTISIDGNEYKTFLIESNLSVIKTYKGVVMMEKAEELTEWFCPELGILKIDRKVQEKNGHSMEQQTQLKGLTIEIESDEK